VRGSAAAMRGAGDATIAVLAAVRSRWSGEKWCVRELCESKRDRDAVDERGMRWQIGEADRRIVRPTATTALSHPGGCAGAARMDSQ